MKIELICITIALAAAISSAAADYPASFYSAMASMEPRNMLCIKNYETGAGFSEDYSDFEYLEKETKVVSRTSNATCGDECEGGRCSSLEASVNSEVVGKAHIAWISMSPEAGEKGRHAEWGRSAEDLVGVFNIEKFVLLWSNSTPGEISTDWMPCV
jgi:hypothetical protein